MNTENMDAKKKAEYEGKWRHYADDEGLVFNAYVIVGVKPWYKMETNHDGSIYCPQPQPQPQRNKPVAKCATQIPYQEREPYWSPIDSGDYNLLKRLIRNSCVYLIFYSSNLQHIDRTAKTVPENWLGTTFSCN